MYLVIEKSVPRLIFTVICQIQSVSSTATLSPPNMVTSGLNKQDGQDYNAKPECSKQKSTNQ